MKISVHSLEYNYLKAIINFHSSTLNEIPLHFKKCNTTTNTSILKSVYHEKLFHKIFQLIQKGKPYVRTTNRYIASIFAELQSKCFFFIQKFTLRVLSKSTSSVKYKVTKILRLTSKEFQSRL